MIDDLLSSKKITPNEYKLYCLYRQNELGREVLDTAMLETFMDEPALTEHSGEGFAFYDGRRSVWRDIRRTILKVEQIIKEQLNDG